MKKALGLIFCLFLIILTISICYAEQEISIPSDAALFEIELLQEGKFPEITAIEPEDKNLADSIYQALHSNEDIIEVDFSGSDTELADLYESVINDNPMLYDVLGIVYVKNVDDNKYILYPQYKGERFDKISLFSSSNPIEEAVNDILAQVNSGMTDVEKMLAVHDYILTHYEYDCTYSYYYTNEFFTYKRGVCNAYALAFKYIMDRIGIECFVVTSSAMNHAWNVVHIDGNYYHIDVTWDDPIMDRFGLAKHEYFLLSDNTMSDPVHRHYGWSGFFKATDTKYDNYFWTYFKSPIQYYNGNWYTAQSGKIYQCSVQNNTKTELGAGDQVGICEGTMYITDSSYNLYTIQMDKISNFKPMLNDCLEDLKSSEGLNGLFIEDGCLKYAVADDEFYEYEYRDDDLPHAVYNNYYEYRYFYSIDLTRYKDTYRLGDNVTWTVDANGNLKVQGSGDMYSSSGKTSFLGYYADSITSVTIENDITSICNYAFYNCTALTSLTIGSGVESVGDYAFSGCTALTQINWNAKNCADFTDKNSVFSCAGQSGDGISVIFGDTAERIPAYVFSPYNYYGTNNTPKITSVHIGNSIKSIGTRAFFNGIGLTSITIPDSVENIGNQAFFGCTSLSQINWNAKNCADFASNVFSSAGQDGDGINVIFGDKVEIIPGNMFDNCSKLKSVTIGENVKRIGFDAFYRCTELTSITIGKSVENIENQAFSGCTSLSQINWNARNCADFAERNSVFYNAGQDGDGISVIFGDTVERIPAYMFSPYIYNSSYSGYQSLKITSITISDSVKSIGASAFYKCTGLTSLTIGNSVESIGGSAFYNCTEITSITISDSVKSIGDSAFCGCSDLTSLTVGNSVESIGRSAFYNCRLLSQINWNARNCADFAESNSVFYNAGQDGDGISVIFGDIAERIPAYMFYASYYDGANGIPKITSVHIGENVKSIGGSAFYNCTGVTSITIPDGVERIGSAAFSGCTGLTSITIPDNVKRIGSSAFSGCTILSQINWNAKNCADFDSSAFPYAGQDGDGISIIFGDTVERIPAKIFMPGYDKDRNPKITSVHIGKNVKSVGDDAFFGCTSLSQINWNARNCADFDSDYSSMFYSAGQNGDGISIIFGDTVERIPAFIFYWSNSKITSVYIGDNVKSIGAHAFYNCAGLTSLTIGNSVESIGDSAFYNCTGLTSLIIGNSVESIGDSAFYGCNGLETLSIGNSVESIGDSAFSGCTALTSLTIGNSVESIGDSAFSGCKSLSQINWNAKNCADFSKRNYVFSRAGQDESGINVIFGDTVERIPAYIFYPFNEYSFPKITSAHISNNVKSIGDYAFYECNELSKVYYNGNYDEWKKLLYGAYYNGPLNKATKYYFAYVTLVDKNGNEICKKMLDLGSTIDISSMITVPDDCIMVLYSDKEWTTLFDTAEQIYDNIDLYAVVIKFNSLEITGEKNITVDGNDISQKIAFVTDKEAKYLVCTVKYPVGLSLKQIKSESFEIEQSSETIGGYNYLYLTCIYNGEGNIPVNTIQSPVEFVFDASENIVSNDVLTLEILDDAVLADNSGNSYAFSDIENSEIRIDKVLASDVEISGEDEVYSETAYTASVLPQNATNRDVKWSVSDTTIATISQSGQLTPIKTGTVTIRATAKDGSGMFAEKAVSVVVIKKVTSINISGADTVSSRATFTATVLPADADDKSIEWSVSDEQVATISQTGVLTPIKTGTVTIRATAKDGSGVSAEKTVSVIVIKKVSRITISGAGTIHSEETYTATVLPEDADDKSIEWSVSDKSVATISQTGILTPIKTGNVTIKATAKDGSGVYGTKTVSVNVPATVTSITSNIGTWDAGYSPLRSNYVIYVPTETTSIKITAKHNGMLKSSDNQTFINSVAKTIVLSSDETVLTLNYSCEGYSDNIYTITITKLEKCVTTNVSEDGKTFVVTPINIETGKKIILALYEDGGLVELLCADYEGETVLFTATASYEKAKVMVWDDLNNLKPVCNAEIMGN